MVCDLQKFVKPADYIDGEYITTAMVVVPTGAKSAEFEKNYWKLEQTEEAQKLFQRDANAKAKALGEDPQSVEMDEEDRKKTGGCRSRQLSTFREAKRLLSLSGGSFKERVEVVYRCLSRIQV